MATTKLYLAIVSRIHGNMFDKNLTITRAIGDSTNHLCPRILPETDWMPRFNRTIDVDHAGDKPTDPEVTLAIKNQVWPLPPQPDAKFDLGANVFLATGLLKESYWVEGRWVIPSVVGYAGGFQIIYDGKPYFQSITFTKVQLLRTDYVLIAQDYVIPY